MNTCFLTARPLQRDCRILYYKDMAGKGIMKRLKQHGWILDRIKGRRYDVLLHIKTGR